MVKSSKKSKGKEKQVTQPPVTGYPPSKKCKCPAEILAKTAMGGKRAS